MTLEDVDDWLGDYPGEMRGITYAIGAEQVALTYRRMPQHTGSKGSYGHRHKDAGGALLRDHRQAAVQARATRSSSSASTRRCGCRPAPGAGVWNDEPEDAELVIVSKRIEDPSADAETIDDFWPA